MAVLHLLLRHDPRARRCPGARRGRRAARRDGLDGQRFLLATYHLIGARSLEDGGPRRLRRARSQAPPEAPVPAVYASEAVFGTMPGPRATAGRRGRSSQR